MDWKVLLTVFGSVFVAELGDKTQLATMLFASNQHVSKLTVFVGAALALVLSSAIGVLAGTVVSNLHQRKATAIRGRVRFHWDWHLDLAQGLAFSCLKVAGG